MEIDIKEHKKIPDGEHEGIIIGVQYRDTPLRYTDYCLAFLVDDERVNVKASYPTNITPETIHGRMLARFGLQIAAGLKVDPDKLIGLKCLFSTVNKTTPKGTFPEVMRDTLKPAPIQKELDKIKVIDSNGIDVTELEQRARMELPVNPATPKADLDTTIQVKPAAPGKVPEQPR